MIHQTQLFNTTAGQSAYLFRQDWGGAKKKKKKQKPPEEAPNTLVSRATARIVEMLSQGPIVGLVDGARSIRFDDIPLMNADGSFNFDGVDWDERTGEPDQTYMEGFPAAEAEEVVGIQLRRNGTQSGSGSSPVGGGALTVSYVTPYAPGDVPTNIVITNISPSPDVTSYAITNITYTGFTIRFRNKNTGVYVQRDFDYEVQDASISVIQTINDPTIDAARVHLRVPAMYTTGSDGDIGANSVSVAIDVQPDGGSYATVKTVAINGKCMSPYEESHRINLPAGGAPWNVRMRRLTPEPTSAGDQNSVYWSGYTKLTDLKLTYEDYAMIGVILDASYFGDDIPVRSYHVKGRILQVPSNYDPETREYDGIWDGTFQNAWSDNPVWVFYDLITHTRYGLGHRIKPENVDKWSLYQIAQYCDELVDDGDGGFEPRYTFNGVISDQEDAYTVLNAVAASFMGMIYWGTDTVTAVQDSPREPNRVVTPANAINGAFNYSGSGLRARATVVYVTWNDPLINYQQRITVVEDQDLINRWGYRQKDVTLVGCTSPGQAYRMGRYILESEKRQTDTVTYVAGLDHADARPGDVHLVQDPSFAGMRLGGRIKSLTDTAVEVDAPIDLPTGTNTMYAVLEDGTVEGRTIATPAASQISDLILSSAFSKPVMPGAMWTISTAQLAPRQFRVISVAETEKHQFEVTAILHDPNKYAFVDEGVVIPATPTTVLGPLPKPPSISYKEYLKNAGGAKLTGAIISWQAPNDTRVIMYEAQIKRFGESEWEAFPRRQGLGVQVEPTTLGSTGFRVRSMDRFGVVSPWQETTFNLVGAYAIPSGITNFVGYGAGQNVNLQWDEPIDGDIDYYQIRFTPAGATVDWGTAQVMGGRKIRSLSTTVPFMNGTYLIKAFDQVGQQSATATEFVVNADVLSGINIVDTVVEQPSWSGTHTNTTVVADNLTLDEEFTNVAFLEGSYETDYFDQTEIYTSRISMLLDVIGDVLGDSISTWPVLADLPAMAGSDNTQYSVEAFISTTQDDPSGSPTWSDWAPILVADYTFRAVKFKLVLRSVTGAVRPAVQRAEFQIDMPDRIEEENGVAVGTGGYSIVYDPPFKVKPSLVANPIGGAAGTYVDITSESRTGVTLHVKDSGGSNITGTVNWLSKGYGRDIT